MSATTRPGGTNLPGGLGDADWTDLQDNWRDVDATWLQERSIIRVSGATPTVGTINGTNGNVAAADEGRVFYSATSKALLVAVSSTPTYKTVTMSNNLTIVDGATTSEIKASAGANGTGITINNTTGALSLGPSSFTGAISSNDYLTSLKAGSAGSISTSASGFTINTSGSDAVNLTTSASGLGVSASVVITGALSTTTSATVGNGLTVTAGGLTVTAGTTSLQATTVGTTLTVTGATTAAAITASGLITAGAGVTVTGAVQSSASNDLVVAASSGQTIRTISNFVFGDTAPGKNTNIKNAWSIYSTTDPAVASVTNKALNTNVATLTTGAAHNLWVGASVTVSGVDTTFNGTYTVTGVPSTTTFTYAKTASNVTSSAVSPAGSVTIPIPDGTVWFS